MIESDKDNSFYLILYFFIILILIFVIYYLSCNNNHIIAKEEPFEVGTSSQATNATSNDIYTLIGIDEINGSLNLSDGNLANLSFYKIPNTPGHCCYR